MTCSTKAGAISLLHVATLVAILAVLLILPALPVLAQNAGVEMRVTPALNGHVKYGEWLPLRVTLTNQGGDLDAEVRADVSGSGGSVTYAASAPLPTGARKEVVLYVQPPSFAQALSVRLVSGGQVLAKAEVDVVPHPRSAYLIGVLASEPDAFAPLNGLTITGRDQAQILPLSVEDLPTRVEALRSIDCLILSALDTSTLTPAQAQALRLWVEGGGRLLIGGGVGARRTLSGLPDALLPVELGETVDMAALDTLANLVDEPIQVSGPFPAVLPDPVRGRVTLEEAGQPLLVQDTMGEGWVSYLALDPAGSPFNAWAGTLAFWRRLLEPGAALEINTPRDIPTRALESEQMSYALSNLPSLELPSVRWVALLLGLYILLVGPLNYLVLRRLRRLDVAWVTIPVLTLVFSLAGYGLGYGLRGNDIIINQISILPLHVGSDSTVARSYVGLFSPSRHDYDLRIDEDALIGPLLQVYNRGGYNTATAPLNVLQGEPTLVRGLAVNQWAMQSFQAETRLEGMADVLEADLTMTEDRVRGTLRNNLERPIEGVIFLLGARFVDLGDVEAGAEVVVDAAFEGGEMGTTFPWSFFQRYYRMGEGQPSQELRLRQSILEAFFHTNWGSPVMPAAPMLLAWTDMQPLTVHVDRARVNQESTTLLVLHVPLPALEGQVTIPLGVLSGRIVAYEGDAGPCGSESSAYLASGEVILEYTLPANMRGVDLSELRFRVRADGMGWTDPPQAAFYDWSENVWVDLDPIERNVVQVIADPDRFVEDTGGTLRLRMAQENRQSGMCYQFEVGLEGQMDLQRGEVAGE